MSLSSRTGWFLVLTTFLKLNIVIPKTLYMSRQLWPLPRLQYLHGNNLQNPPTHSPQPMLIEIYKQKTKPYSRCFDELEMIENSTQYSLEELPPPQRLIIISKHFPPFAVSNSCLSSIPANSSRAKHNHHTDLDFIKKVKTYNMLGAIGHDHDHDR